MLFAPLEPDFTSGFMPQGIGADLIATLDGFNRERIDQYVLHSHQKATDAWQNEVFKQSIIPVKDKNNQIILSHDEMVRSDCSMQALAKQFGLKPRARIVATALVGTDPTIIIIERV